MAKVPKSDDGRPGADEAICDKDARTIWISSLATRERQEEVLIHEVLHALMPPVLDDATEEQIVEALAPRLHAAIVSGALSATTEGVG